MISIQASNTSNMRCEGLLRYSNQVNVVINKLVKFTTGYTVTYTGNYKSWWTRDFII